MPPIFLTQPLTHVALVYVSNVQDAEDRLLEMISRRPYGVGLDVEAVAENVSLVQVCDGETAVLVHVALMEGTRLLNNARSFSSHFVCRTMPDCAERNFGVYGDSEGGCKFIW